MKPQDKISAREGSPSTDKDARRNSPTAPLEQEVLPSVFPPLALANAHALLDSGQAWKLERFGDVVLARPDPQALWRRRLPQSEWKAAHLTFERESDRGGRWRPHPKAPAHARGRGAAWELDVLGARLVIRPTPFKHVGLFPEQACNWAWITEQRSRLGPAPKLLNLFGYTGAASILSAKAGYRVTHVDASKTSVAWARENAAASGLPGDSVRWMADDAVGFARREVRRGHSYAGILLDPPHFGRGPKGEKWVFEEGLADLIGVCGKLLAPDSFLILSTYAIGYSPLAFTNLLGELEGGTVQAGELILSEESRAGQPTRSLPCGFCARWTRSTATQ